MKVVKPVVKVLAVGGCDGGREREREGERGSAGSRKEGGRLVFCRFWTRKSPPLDHENKIYL
jgi:hypothetical protein